MFVAGVGASAGGLEALERLFKAMPPDSGIAFVVIQHLSPDFKSLMDELLARHTAMPIHRVEDRMAVQANHIYLIPPKKEMIISEGQLLLTDKDPGQDLSLPIDHFFRSLAQDCGRRAIAVVLSGTGSDGSRGIRDVHEAGGLVIAQSEETAKFDGMPRSAVDSGVVDCVLPPEEMPKSLIDYVTRFDEPCPPKPGVNGVRGVDAIFKLLREEYGIDFSYYKPNTVTRRIERRLSLNQSLDLDDYVEVLQRDPGELNSLYRDLLIGVTRFFRDKEAFDRLEHEIVPDLLTRRRTDDELRIWVAGCATGEEAYSLAMLLHERLELLKRPMEVKIFASDVHRASLEVASAGVYDEEALSEVSRHRLERYFIRKPDGYHVTGDLRQMIVFARHNLIKDAPFTKLDLITCRNLLIYLQPAAQKKVLSLFHFGLKTGGVLFLGPSETPGELDPEFEPLDQHWKIYRKRRDIRLPADLRLPLSTPSVQLRAPSMPPTAGSLDAPLLGAYDRLLEEYMPPGLLVNERRQLVHAFGGGGRYLRYRDGRPTADILDLLEGDLKLALAGAMQRAAKDQAPVVYNGIRVRTASGEEQLKISVKPLLNRRSNLTHLFITLESLGAAESPHASQTEIDADEASREHLNSLETELRYTRENLQATIEELETSNEELQASNEELVASNEELQSTNEELHSVNEELYTVNAEYQKKITELTELTDDMDNLLRSTDIGTIFLDDNLCIRKFTPQIGRAFDLLPQDVGRRIDTFSHSIRYDGLLDEIAAVLRSSTPIEKDVQDRHGNWFFLRILPYRSHSKTEGVVLTLIDISTLKKTEARVAQLSAIVESSDDAIIGMDLEGQITSWNRGAQRLFGYAAEEVLGKSISLLEPDGDDVQATWTPETLKRVRNGQSENHQLETIRRRKDGSCVEVLLSLSPILDSSGRVTGASAIARDITGRKQAERALAERARMAALQANIGLALASDDGLRRLLQNCAERLVEHLEVALARIWTLDRAGEVLELHASAGQSTDLDGADSRIPLGETTIGRIAQTQQPLLTNDVPNDPQVGDPEWARRDGIIVFAGYPLVVAGRTVGVMAMFGRRPLPENAGDDLGPIAQAIAQCIERQRTEQELHETVARCMRAEEEARDAVRKRDQFLAMLSHELRNPLAAVLDAARVLDLAANDRANTKRAHHVIRRQSQHMARLLDDLLDVSRITRNKIEIRKQTTDLCVTAREALDAVRPFFEEQQLELEVDLPEAPVCVEGDPARLQQIQVNLLNNAAKYTPPGGRVRLSIAHEGDKAVLRVRDTGIGLREDMREKIFELFVQSDGAGSNSGMGVGLTLVRSLAQLHGGTATAHSEGPGRGSEFVVTLPASAAAAEWESGEPVNCAPARRRILLVEDHPAVREMTLALLEASGHEIVAAEDGPAGIDAVGRLKPDVALVDIGLPNMDGYEVARRIRELPEGRDLLLVAVTGYGQPEDRRRALESGFDAHLVKPVDLNGLARLLERNVRAGEALT